MTVQLVYCDTSALAKLVMVEDGSDDMTRMWESPATRLVSSELLVTELLRTARRHSAASAKLALHVVAGVHFVALSRDILMSAGNLEPPALRSLDAIHLATALALGHAVAALATYDQRMLQAAQAHGLAVLPSPI